MLRRITIAAATACLISVNAAAQEGSDLVGAGPVEIAAVPGGGTFFMKTPTGEPKFRNYSIGASLTGNVNRWFGIEGDLSLALGRRQTLDFIGGIADQKTPTMLGYNGSALISPWGSDRRVAPYLAAGLGAMTMFNTADVEAIGVTDNRTFFTTNVGFGLKWFPVSHWGARGDYRYFMIRDDADAPVFFGQEKRNAHRVYGGIVYTY